MLPAGKGNINVERYVALGDSITAGYADGALHYNGQQNSYANIMAGQFKLIGSTNFRQPLLDKDSVGIDLSGHSRLSLKKTNENSGLGGLSLAFLAPKGDADAFTGNIYSTQGPFYNIAVPGAKITSIRAKGYGNPENGQGNYNPFFARMVSSPNASILEDALARNPTFFSLFIGNNDALGYALTGGTTDIITPLTGSPGIGFEESLSAIINALTDNGAKGVIANLPDLLSVPFFTTIPYNGLLLTEANASLLNEKYKAQGISFHEGKNSFLIHDSINTPGVRKIKKGELILFDLLLDSDKLLYMKAGKPIPKKYVLLAGEINKIQNAVNGYNLIIESIATKKGLALVNVNALLKTAKKDRFFNCRSLDLNFRKKGVFSLDSLHPNPFGHALLANEFIKAINETYGSTIPKVKSARYAGVVFPE
ncbi:MAG TPA: SGNH/GDSL hydrolase family protein [Bacteroidia bacterium]|jgi:lysophospholipase L1-like esterase|nr:SGNH/GDSL hydrolase family protein [Bacteroidia bacterium]